MAINHKNFFAIFIHPPLNPRDNASDSIMQEGKAMDWRAANERQNEALWRVFLMFVAMAVLVIRTGLVSRGVLAVLPPENTPRDDVPTVRDHPSSTPPADVHQATLILLCLAEVAGRLFILKERTVRELMNQPAPQPAQERPLNTDSLCERPTQRLDTS